MTAQILTLNGGSSSIKFALFQPGETLRRLLSGQVKGIGTPNAELEISNHRGGETERHRVSVSDHVAAIPLLTRMLEERIRFDAIGAVGHRIVHGGPRYREPERITSDLLAYLEQISPYDPEHLPMEIGIVRALAQAYPRLVQVACFDTTFHRDLPRVAKILPIPCRYFEQGVQRYGFHGLSYAYLIDELRRVAGTAAANGRVILAHLGNGASLVAVREGRSLDTSMAFTPTAGLVMGTRAGDLDPGLAAYLARVEQMTPDQFYRMANFQAGLLGVSETSSNVRELLAREKDDPRAADAIGLFCYQAKKFVGAYAAALGGLDTLVFSEGIGENAPLIRARICEGLQFLGLELDGARNEANAPVISAATSRVTARVIKTDEELQIAQSVARFLMKAQPLSRDLLRKMDAWWRAANYLSVGQIYLYGNPLLRKPLTREHVKPRLLGHWGTTPGLNFIYVHLNRVIVENDLDMIFICGPGHGGPGVVATTYLEGTYSEVYPHISQDEQGLQRLFKQFSFPGGIPSHVAPETPGSIHEGGELGYSLAHAYGAAFDNPDLIVACVVGDGEAETGPLATGWHGNKFLNSAHDGAVLPILHLNGYKIAGPSLLARIPRGELDTLMLGYGYEPRWVEGDGDNPVEMHQRMAAALHTVISDIRAIQSDARINGFKTRPTWPLIILATPKGWTGPKELDGVPIEGTFRAHQVALEDMSQPEQIRQLERWMKSYRPAELFDEHGAFRAEFAEIAPRGERRMSANPHANGGLLLRELELPDFGNYAVRVAHPGAVEAESTRVMAQLLRDVLKLNQELSNFRIFGPDETTSNRLTPLWEVTDRTSTAVVYPSDDHVSPDGRVMEVLSEHQCEGWLEGYLLTGRHGFFSCYEAFIHIVDSMFNQHAKWLGVTRNIPWRRPIASLNLLLTSHVWRQDHNGFTHQDPGFLDLVANKKANVIRSYLPPDANTLLSVTDHCLRSKHYVNVIVAGKHPEPQWLDIEAAIAHCAAGIGVWTWASNDGGGEPDVVMACAGDVPTMETLAAVDYLWHYFPDLKVRTINVVDLFRLEPNTWHSHGLSDRAFDALFTQNKPVIFAFHGYPGLIHKLTYKRTNHDNFHVQGYKEEGTTTTPFDMVVMNELDRFHLAMKAIQYLPHLGEGRAQVTQELERKLSEHKQYTRDHGEDVPEVRNWKWGAIRDYSPG